MCLGLTFCFLLFNGCAAPLGAGEMVMLFLPTLSLFQAAVLPVA